MSTSSRSLGAEPGGHNTHTNAQRERGGGGGGGGVAFVTRNVQEAAAR